MIQIRKWNIGMAQKEGRQDWDGLEELNILQGLSPVEFAEVRALVIDMVLATDMSAHFEHVKQMRLLLSAPDRYTHTKIPC